MAVDMFLKLDGIKGESKDHKHKDEIHIESFSWGMSQTGAHGAGGGGGAGKVAMHDFNFNMFVNKASPKLMLACATGDHLKTAKLTVRKAGGDQQEFMTITFSDILVSSYSTGGSSGGDSVPTESISLNFAKVEFEYKPQKPDGTLDSPVKTGYNLSTNKKI